MTGKSINHCFMVRNGPKLSETVCKDVKLFVTSPGRSPAKDMWSKFLPFPVHLWTDWYFKVFSAFQVTDRSKRSSGTLYSIPSHIITTALYGRHHIAWEFVSPWSANSLYVPEPAWILWSADVFAEVATPVAALDCTARWAPEKR